MPDLPLSVPQTIHDLTPVVSPAEENREQPHAQRGLINFKIKDEGPMGHGPEPGPDRGMFRATMGMSGKAAHVNQSVFNPRSRPLHSIL